MVRWLYYIGKTHPEEAKTALAVKNKAKTSVELPYFIKNSYC